MALLSFYVFYLKNSVYTHVLKREDVVYRLIHTLVKDLKRDSALYHDNQNDIGQMCKIVRFLIQRKGIPEGRIPHGPALSFR